MLVAETRVSVLLALLLVHYSIHTRVDELDGLYQAFQIRYRHELQKRCQTVFCQKHSNVSQSRSHVRGEEIGGDRAKKATCAA